MSLSILIIDDDAAFRRLLELRLKSFLPGSEFKQVDSLTRAREFLNANQSTFDLIVLDQHLPDGRGLELLAEGHFQDLAVLAVSSDTDPKIPGATLQAGATYFLAKRQISEALFQPLVLGLIERNKLQRELAELRLNMRVVDTIKTLVSTLRHEINNPLGAVLGAAYIMQSASNLNEDQKSAARVVESSGKRIKHVLDELCKTVLIEPVMKANEKVFHIPGDKPWGEEER